MYQIKQFSHRMIMEILSKSFHTNCSYYSSILLPVGYIRDMRTLQNYLSLVLAMNLRFFFEHQNISNINDHKMYMNGSCLLISFTFPLKLSLKQTL